MIVVHIQEVAFFFYERFRLKWFIRAKVSWELGTFVQLVQLVQRCRLQI